MAISYDRLGGRVIELLIPFEHMGKKIEAVKLKAFTLDHTLRWQQGAFRSSLALLAALSGEGETTLRMLRYPDVDRVLGAMMDMLPEAIRNDISQGMIPQPQANLNGNEKVTGSGMSDPTEDQPFTGLGEKL